MKLLVFLLLPCLSLSEVGDDFSKCDRFFLNNVPPQFTAPAGISVQHICQCLWDENDQQKYLYATLYSTAWRIPIYSAYEFGKESTGRCDVWYIEPQLDEGNTAEPCMRPKGRNKDIGNNQAVNSDYKQPKGSSPTYDRGHLYPVQHTYNHVSMLATSTLTNAAPQESRFNQIKWKDHEKAVIEDLKDCEDTAYVVTGVVPDTNKPKLNNRVTVSKYYWRATCCKKNGQFKGQGYYGPDNNDKVQSLSITALQTLLNNGYGMNIIIFPSLPIPAGHKRPRTDGCY